MYIMKGQTHLVVVDSGHLREYGVRIKNQKTGEHWTFHTNDLYIEEECVVVEKRKDFSFNPKNL